MFEIRKIVTITEDVCRENGREVQTGLRRCAVMAVIKNDGAGQYIENLQDYIDNGDGTIELTEKNSNYPYDMNCNWGIRNDAYWKTIKGGIPNYDEINDKWMETAKDNRAFCKYLCPITVFLKPMSYFSLLRVHCDEDKCIHCGKCLRICPMNVEANRESRKRKNGTECILCYECTKACPTKALH